MSLKALDVPAILGTRSMWDLSSKPVDTEGMETLPAGLSVVIPVFNSETMLSELIGELERALRSLGQPFEVILVNDCSRDNSWLAIRSLAKEHDFIRGFSLMKNYGQHNALLCGVRAARFATSVTMDDDLQHLPEEVPRLLEKLQEGFDVVYGVPQVERHGLARTIVSQTTKIVLQRAMGAETARHVSAFRAFRTDLRQGFEHHRGSLLSIDVLLTWATNRFSHTRVRHAERRHGASNYTLSRLIAHAFNMLTGFSVIPLQLASLAGFILTFFGVCVFVFVLGRYLLEGTTAPGFPFLASIIAIFSGAQLCALGIIGEYLARMHFRLMDRPPYMVRETTPTQHAE